MDESVVWKVVYYRDMRLAATEQVLQGSRQ